jgi:hypothetical protein
MPCHFAIHLTNNFEEESFTFWDVFDVIFTFSLFDIFKRQELSIRYNLVTFVDTTIQLAIIVSGALGLSIPFGLYIARMISFETRPLEKTVAKVERGFFRLIGINIDIEGNKVSNMLVFAPLYMNVLQVNLDLITGYPKIYQEFAAKLK